MLRNITLSADEELIRKARQKSQREQTTLNATFRQWLKQYTNSNSSTFDFEILMNSLEYVNSGKNFTRDEFNER